MLINISSTMPVLILIFAYRSFKVRIELKKILFIDVRICSLIKIKPLTASYYFDCRVNQTGIYTVYPGVFMRVSKFGEKGVLCIIFFICVSDFFGKSKSFLYQAIPVIIFAY